MCVTWACQPCQLTWITRDSYSSSYLANQTYPSQLVTRLEHSRPSDRALNCPQCRQQTFRTISVGPMEIEICSQCRGLVLDPGETVFAIRSQLNSPETAAAASGDALCFVFEIIFQLLCLSH